MAKSRVYENVVAAIGNTPIVRLNRLSTGLAPTIYVKLEACNPGGSVKDRIAPYIVKDAEARGLLKPGGTIVEATSGNTGVGLCLLAIQRGYKMVAVMSSKQSVDKVNILKAFGAEVVMCPAEVEPDDPRSYYSVAKRLSEEIPNAVLANQYHNSANAQAHYETTGPEIWSQMDGDLDYYVAGVGTGGTISGVSRFLKEKKPSLRSYAVDPIGSILTDYHRSKKIVEAGSYLIEGIGEDIIPANVHFQHINEFVQVNDQESITALHRLAREEGIFAGASCGAAIAGALKTAAKLGPGNMLVILPDSGHKYLGKFYNPEWLKKNGIEI